jgi:hypothetical protein
MALPSGAKSNQDSWNLVHLIRHLPALAAGEMKDGNTSVTGVTFKMGSVPPPSTAATSRKRVGR